MSSRLRAAIVGLLWLGVMMACLDRVNPSVAPADKDFRSYFQLSDQDRGPLNSALFWPYVVMQIPAGRIIDRYRLKSPCAVGFFVWSLVSAGTAWAASVHLLRGVGESVITPAVLSLGALGPLGASNAREVRSAVSCEDCHLERGLTETGQR